jgi:polyribonucleotide 5'-hydroxyl-kinase
MSNNHNAAIRVQELPPRSELRFELEPKERLSVRLIPGSGDCNVFGADLIPGTTADRWYTFGDETKACLATLNGCQLELIGTVTTEYLAEDEGIAPLMRMYANVHLYLEAKRIEARNWLKEDIKRIGSSSIFNTLAQSSLVLSNEGVPVDFDADINAEDPIYRPQGQGPRVMIVGPESSGKSTLIKFLANYALKSPAICNPAQAKTDKGDEGSQDATSDANGWWPSIVSLDPSTGAAPLPCTLSILPLSPIPQAALPSPSPAFPYGLTTSTTGALPPVASAAHTSNTFSLWLGRENARDNERHTKRAVDWLAFALEKRLARDPRARCSGVLIDTPGIITADAKNRYSLLQHYVKALKVDTIIVLGHEKLNVEMTKLFGAQGSGISVVKLPKSDGVVEFDSSFKQKLRSLQVRNYFYGGSSYKKVDEHSEAQDENGEMVNEDGMEKTSKDSINNIAPSHVEPLGGLPLLSPYSTTIPFEVLEVYSVGQESKAPSSALPIGAQSVSSATQLVKLDHANSAIDQSNLLHSILPIIQPPRGGGGPGVADSKVDPPPTDDEILGAPILGFVHVAEVDAARKKMTVLSPSPGRLPSKTALIGTLDWQDL